MKVCFIGMGSIGMRHLCNLRQICSETRRFLQVDILRHGKGKDLPSEIFKFIDHQYFAESDLSDYYDIIFITNPTSLHYRVLTENLKRAQHFFIEKPVFDRKYEFSLPPGTLAYVACPLRYAKVIQAVHEIVRNGEQIFAVRAMCSSYLPDWRPNTDYRTNYSARKELGGGVKIDLIHELDYLSYLFGFPQVVQCMSGTFSKLEINSEDLAMYLCSYPDKLVSIYLDYLGRTPQREIQLFCEDYVITADILKSNIRYERRGELIKQLHFSEEANDKYLAEMRFFLDCVDGRVVNHNDVTHAQEVLRLAERDE